MEVENKFDIYFVPNEEYDFAGCRIKLYYLLL